MLTDEEIMLNVQRGKFRQMGDLFERYSMQVKGYYLNLGVSVSDAEDLVQDVFWRMLRYRDSFSSSHRVRSWMFQIARNRLHDFRSKQAKLSESAQKQGVEAVSIDHATGRDASISSDDKVILADALEALPESKREVLVLARFQDLPYKEIANVLDCSVANVKVRVHRALEELRMIYLAKLKGADS